MDRRDSYDFIRKENRASDKLLQFGKAPGLSYLFGMQPAIFSTWPDLDSNTTEKFAGALSEIDGTDRAQLPVVIINPDFEGEVFAEKKYDLLLDFLRTWKYNSVFDNGRFEVYTAK